MPAKVHDFQKNVQDIRLQAPKAGVNGCCGALKVDPGVTCLAFFGPFEA